jgi:phenylalanine-4-hydroxylase
MLHENGLIETVIIEEGRFIPEDRLSDIEKIIRLHYELDINLEGIEVIIHLLRRMEDTRREMTALKNRLRMYESINGTSL